MVMQISRANDVDEIGERMVVRGQGLMRRCWFWGAATSGCGRHCM